MLMVKLYDPLHDRFTYFYFTVGCTFRNAVRCMVKRGAISETQQEANFTYFCYTVPSGMLLDVWLKEVQSVKHSKKQTLHISVLLYLQECCKTYG